MILIFKSLWSEWFLISNQLKMINCL